MRTILINIDCGETHCDGCQYLTEYKEGEGVICTLFYVINENTITFDMPRPAKCLEAERKVKEVVDED